MDDRRFADMISKIGHELRSPLTSLKGFSSTLLKRWDRFSDDDKRELVETIHHDAERMGRIIGEVLDLARVESGRLELSPRRTDVAAAARRAAGFVARLTGAGRIEVDVGDGVTVWADPDRLEHVLVNLLENAVKFSDVGPIILSAAAGDGEVSVSVADEGIGIDPDRLGRLFDGPAPAAGGHATPSGTGLGLYLSSRLIAAHGGSIEVESEPGSGSRFTVVLPADPQP